MVKIIENPIKMDDLGVPLFLEGHPYIYIEMSQIFRSKGLRPACEAFHSFYCTIHDLPSETSAPRNDALSRGVVGKQVARRHESLKDFEGFEDF